MQIEELVWWRQISKWWALIVLGAIVLLAGLAIQSGGAMVIGAILALVGACGESFDHLAIKFGGAGVVLKRKTVEEAVLRIATDRGVPLSDAQVYARAVAAEFPESGAPVKIIDSGDAEASLSETSSIVFRVPPGKKLSEEELAEELAESQAEYLTAGGGTDLADQLSDSSADPRQAHTRVDEPGPNHRKEVTESPSPGKLDPDKHSLIYSTGRYSLRKYEVQPGSKVTIGRGEDNDLPLFGPRVSRTHALLDCPKEGPAAISNLASTHGVYVNGVRVEGQVLAGGDEICIGDFTLYYEAPRPGGAAV
jgi:hypothetical protein